MVVRRAVVQLLASLGLARRVSELDRVTIAAIGPVVPSLDDLAVAQSEPDVPRHRSPNGYGSRRCRTAYDRPNDKAVHAQFDKMLDALADKLPAVAEHLDGARADVLAFTEFPEEIWRQIWSNDPQE